MSEKIQLNPRATEFRPLRHENGSDTILGEMINALHMPKVEMMSFDGDPIKYLTFIKAFENSVGRFDIDEHAKLTRLLQYCKGKAYRVIESCAATETGGYRWAKDLLKERFGDRYAISASWIGRITSVPRVTNDTLEGFADDLLGFRETMHALECLSEINQQVLVKTAEKLPTYLQHR